MARFLTRKLGATLRALTFQKDGDVSRYRGGYDIDLTYGQALPPSDDICYPISSTNVDRGSHDGSSTAGRYAPRHGLRPEKGDGDRYGHGVERYGHRREAVDTKKPLSPVPEYVREFESKPEDRYGYGDERRKKREEASWGFDYGYGGRRVRYREEEKVDPFGVLIDYAKEDMDKKRKKKMGKKKERDGRKPSSYEEDLGRVYGVGRGEYKRSEDGGRGGGGGLFRRSEEEVYGKEGVGWGGGGRFQKTVFGVPDGKQGRRYDNPKSGVPSWDSEVEYSYGGRRWKYDDQDDGIEGSQLGKKYGQDDLFKKKPYGEDRTHEKRYGKGEIREYNKFGENEKDEGGYRRSKEKYGYGERKPADYGRPTYGQQRRLREEEDGRWRQRLSSELTNYNPSDIIDESEEEWMRERDRRRTRP